jgi:hypothetical protein
MTADEVELRSSRAAGVAGTAAGCALVVCAGEVKLCLYRFSQVRMS